MYYTSSVDIYYIHEWMNGINKNYEIRILKRGWRNKKSPFFFFGKTQNPWRCGGTCLNPSSIKREEDRSL